MASKRPPPSLKARAIALLAQREHSVGELRLKLLRHAARRAADGPTDEAGNRPAGAAGEPAGVAEDAGPVEHDVDALIAWLQAHDYLNERRFTESRVRAREGRYGERRIRQELAQHGVELDAETARSLRAGEGDRAAALLLKKFPSPPGDAAERARQMRFLLARGFAGDAIREAFRRQSEGGPAGHR